MWLNGFLLQPHLEVNDFDMSYVAGLIPNLLPSFQVSRLVVPMILREFSPNLAAR